MLDPDKNSTSPTARKLKDDLNRSIRSLSPGIKRDASEMGGADREPDVDMTDPPNSNSGSKPGHDLEPSTNSDFKAKQQDTGERHNTGSSPQKETDISHPGVVQQHASSDSTAPSTTNSLHTRSTHSTSATSLEASASTDLPTIDEQVQKVTQLASKEPQDRQKGYLVSQTWLNRVTARSSQPPAKFDKSAIDGEIGAVDNKDIVMVIEDSGNLLDEAGEKFVPLRPGLTFGTDYQILPQEAWSLIVDWYGLAKDSPVITRYAHARDPHALVPEVQYELEPPIFSVLKVPAEHTSQTQRETDMPPQQLVASKFTNTMDWLHKVKTLVKIDMATKVRVWRILGGLKSSSASGMLTPAASRSASPAPGTEIVATAGDHMLLDPNTLATLNPEQKQLLDELRDLTNDTSYNGKSTLDTLGLGGSRLVVVLEEQKGGPAGGEWPTENARWAKPKSQRDKVQNLTPSGRTSPAPGGMMTRGRAGKQGRPKGLNGFSNLGNTCYMNSALQSIRSVEELTQYFLTTQWKEDLNTDNPLGYGGQVARAYAGLIKQIYDDPANGPVNPSKFKSVIGRLNGSFAGYQQQDSQELFTFLLDGLSEDLNRIHKKPYIEKPDSTDEMVHNHKALQEFADRNWADYKARNDSVVTDLFAGMYKSQLTCPVCGKVSIIFDPFSNLTLQLPIANNWEKEIVFIPLHKRPMRIDIEVDKNSTMLTLKEFVAARTGTDPKRLVVAESYKNKFYKVFDNPIVISEANIQSNDIICVFELDSVPTNYNPNKMPKKSSLFTTFSSDDGDKLVDAGSPEAERIMVPLFHRLVKSPGSRSVSRPFFALPSYVVMDRKHNQTYDGVLKKILGNVVGMTSKQLFEEKEFEDLSEDSDTVVTMDGSSSDPTATSEQNEDGFVDVSMRDPSVGPGTGDDELKKIQNIIESNKPLPSVYKGLFDVCVHSTGEGIPTGWNQVNEHTDYTNIKTRVPKSNPRRQRKRTSSSDTSDEDRSESSDEDLPDIHYGETTPAGTDSSAESSASTPLPSTEESDHEINMYKSRGKQRNKSHKSKGRNFIRKHKEGRRTTVTQQPSPPLSADEGIVRPGEVIILDWSEDGYQALFGGNEDDDEEMRGGPTWKNVPLLPDPQLQATKKQRTDRRKNGITLEDCLNEFGKPETLSEQNAWYCPRCKEHRRAEKKFELWRAPDILVMHLKRFSSQRNFRDKLDIRVDYPVEGLDISKMVQDTEGKDMVYDLIAVDNHYGGLGGGHYTAYAKNFTNGEWYEFNDAHVSGRSPDAVVTPAAYLLFYRRRRPHPLGGEKLEKLLSATHLDSEAQGSRETSPHANTTAGSGEGRRLGDSSHNGSSSAYPAGRAHLVGDGGSVDTEAKVQKQANHDLSHATVESGRVVKSVETTNHQVESDLDEELPPYEDDPVTMAYDSNTQPIWDSEPGWGWSAIGGSGGGAIMKMVPPPNSDNGDVFGNDDQHETGSNDSTRVEGMEGSDPDITDTPVWSDAIVHGEEGDSMSRRGMRESAPPPMTDNDTEMVSIPIGQTQGEDEDEDDLPVAELRAGEDGEMNVQHVPK